MLALNEDYVLACETSVHMTTDPPMPPQTHVKVPGTMDRHCYARSMERPVAVRIGHGFPAKAVLTLSYGGRFSAQEKADGGVAGESGRPAGRRQLGAHMCTLMRPTHPNHPSSRVCNASVGPQTCTPDASGGQLAYISCI